MNLQRRAVSITMRLAGLALFVFHAATPDAVAAQSPSIDVLGSYFPAWLVCIVAGVALTVVIRLLFVAWKLDGHLLPAPLLYPCLTAALAMTLWLVFFRN